MGIQHGAKAVELLSQSAWLAGVFQSNDPRMRSRQDGIKQLVVDRLQGLVRINQTPITHPWPTDVDLHHPIQWQTNQVVTNTHAQRRC